MDSRTLPLGRRTTMQTSANREGLPTGSKAMSSSGTSRVIGVAEAAGQGDHLRAHPRRQRTGRPGERSCVHAPILGITGTNWPLPPGAATGTTLAMEQHNWRKVFAYTGLAVIGLVLAYYATAVGNAGIAAGLLGKKDAGADLFTGASAALLVGMAMLAVFGYLALRSAWMTVRAQPR